MTTRLGCESNSEHLVVAACRLVASGSGVRSVRVLRPSRPSYDELWCYRDSARVYHVHLSVDGTGMVTVWPERGAQG